MTTTAPIQAPASASSATRAGKPQSNAQAASFNALLSQEVAQRNNETTIETDKTDRAAISAPAQKEQKVKAEEKKQPYEAALPSNATATTSDLLTLVADIAQLTAKVPADPTAVALAAEVQIDPKTKKTASLDLGKLASSEKDALSVDRDALAASEPKHTRSNAAAPDFAATMLRHASTGANTPLANTTAPDVASTLTTTLPETAIPMQQAMAPFAVQGITGASDKLMPPVGTPAWDQALGNKIVWLAGSDMQTASLTLNPPDLGPLQVVLNVANNQATATFSAAQPEVRQALEAAMPKLREMMGEAGIQLGQATVDAGTPNRQEAPDRDSGSRQSKNKDAISTSDNSSPILARPVAMAGRGLVDTFA